MKGSRLAPLLQRTVAGLPRRRGASREGLKATGVGGGDERLAAGAAPTADRGGPPP